MAEETKKTEAKNDPVDFSSINHVYEYNVKKGTFKLINDELPTQLNDNFYDPFQANSQSSKLVKPSWDPYALEWWAANNHVHRACIELKATLIAGFGYIIRNKAHENYEKLEAFLKKPNTEFGDTFSKITLNLQRFKTIYGSAGLFVAKALDVLQVSVSKNYKSIFVEPVTVSGRRTSRINKFVQVSRDNKHKISFEPYDGDPQLGKRYLYRIGNKTLQNTYYPEPEYLPVLGKLQEDFFVDQNNIDFFKNRARPDVVFVFTGGKLDTKDKTSIQDRYKKDFEDFKGPNNAHKSMVLEATAGAEIKIHDLSKNEDGQYSTRQQNLELSIARSHRIMPSLLLLRTGGSGFGGGGVAVGDLFLENQIMIRPEQEAFEEDMNIFLESLFGFDPQIKFKTIDTNNQKDMATILTQIANLKILAKKEGRKYIVEHGIMEIEPDIEIPEEDLIIPSKNTTNSDGDDRTPGKDAKPDDVNAIDENKNKE